LFWFRVRNRPLFPPSLFRRAERKEA